MNKKNTFNKLFVSIFGILLIGFTVGVITIFLTGCESIFGEKNKPEPNTVSKPIEIKQLDSSAEQYDRYYQIYTLEGCEYIVVSPGNSHFTWGTHKGNCKNPIHDKTR